MQNYTDEDVYVEMRDSKHIKNNHKIIKFKDSFNFFNNAERKFIAAYVYDIVKTKKYSINRYLLHVVIGVVKPLEINENLNFDRMRYYWKMGGENLPPQVARYDEIPFGPMVITIPLTSFGTDRHLNHIIQDQCKGPRISLRPPYGSEYIYGFDNTVRASDVANYASAISATANRIYKLFVDDNEQIV